MRNTFIKELIEIAQKDKNIFLLVGDLGFSVVEPFSRNYPDRFLNCGVAEQNMTGIAAGLAMEGYKVFTYSIANFNTLRCFFSFVLLNNFSELRRALSYSPSTRNVLASISLASKLEGSSERTRL